MTLVASAGEPMSTGGAVLLTLGIFAFAALVTLLIYPRRPTNRRLVGFNLPIDWIIDEFDASFNQLACASLRYHLDHSVADNDEHREEWEALITRLSEPEPEFTDAEMAVLEPPGWTFEDDFEPLPDGRYLLRKSSPERLAAYEAHRLRDVAYDERIQQARHDFINVLPKLWS